MKLLRGIVALALTLACAPALAQVTPGTTPLSGPKGGTNNAFMQFTGPATSLKSYALANASGTIAMLSQIQTWTGAQSFTDGTLILLGSGSGSSTIKAPATGGGIATLFPGADTIVGAAATQTLTNKTFNCANNTSCVVRIASDVSGLGTGVATALGVNVGTAGAVVVNGGALGTPLTGVGTNLTGTAAGLTAGNVTTNANLTGPVTSVGNATTIGANQVSRANEVQGIARSVMGVTGNATANVADIQLSASQFLGTTAANTSLAGVGYGPAATAAAGQIPGEPTTGSATAGNVGEYVVSDTVQGSPLGLSTGVLTNLENISLTAGDWDVSFTPKFTGGATTNVTVFRTSISATSATRDQTLSRTTNQVPWTATPFSVDDPTVPVGLTRFSLSTTTTIFGVVQCSFTVSTCSAYGTLRARRVR